MGSSQESVVSIVCLGRVGCKKLVGLESLESGFFGAFCDTEHGKSEIRIHCNGIL